MRPIDRRQFLKLGATAAALPFLSSPVLKALGSTALPSTLTIPRRSSDPIAAALGRIGFGAAPGQVEKIQTTGLEAYFEAQLYPELIYNTAALAKLQNYPTLEMSGPQLVASKKSSGDIATELVGGTILRAVYSEGQLEEVMVNFWTDHFSIFHRKGACLVLKTLDDRDVIRKHAFGKFRDLLGASAKSAAMLLYLDNFKSHRANPNENYAREVMELHTITTAHYNELDMRAVARAMTGWTFIDNTSSRNYGGFAYTAAAHDDTEKIMFGQVFAAGGGIEEGERVLDILAAHPGTARNIATKLCRRFISDAPPESIIATVADTFLRTDGDIRELLRAIFRSDEFKAAPPKFKRPFEYFVSLCRATGLQMTSPVRKEVLETLRKMNHYPFDWHAPNGYSDTGAYWIGNMLERWNTAYNTINGLLTGTKLDLIGVAIANGAANDPDSILDYYLTAMIGESVSEADRATIFGFFTRAGSVDLNTDAGQQALREAVSLIAASPTFQYR